MTQVGEAPGPRRPMKGNPNSTAEPTVSDVRHISKLSTKQLSLARPSDNASFEKTLPTKIHHNTWATVAKNGLSKGNQGNLLQQCC
ncbi:hypothetical protein Golomagni_03917 [Golovinomyces magnicellulatus]|nr:hypothetical protein Golomagni_03917 [Golovinomyces magnicellulatus]